MSLLKIVHVCDKFGMAGSAIHGASRLFSWWLPRFDRTRYDVVLYALKHPDVASRALEDTGVALKYLGTSGYDPTAVLSFRRLIAEERADVLHLHGWASSNFGRLAGSLAGIPTIMHEHGAHPHMPLSQRIADRLLASRTQAVVAVSQAAHDFLVGQRYVDPAKIRRIYNGAPLREFQAVDAAASAAERARLGFPPEGRIVGAIARLSEEKGLDTLLRAAALVAQRIPALHVLLVGDGPLREPLETLARELGIERRVVFTGYRTDVPLLQSLLEIQTFTSHWEGAPLALFEAMAMGKPIASSDAGGLGEILRGTDAALLVPPADPAALAGVLTRMLEDADLRTRVAGNARELGRRFDIDHTVRQLEALYEALAGARRTGR